MCLLAVAVLLTTAALGQASSGALTGIVQDESKAVIPGADVILKNEGTNDVRRTVTNDEGYFSLQAIPTGTYMLRIEMAGFSAWERTGIVFHAGDRPMISDITLKVAGTAERVEVSASPVGAIPMDTGEKSAVINQKQLQTYSVVGRSAMELLRILPGMVSDTQQRPGEVSFGSAGRYWAAGTRDDALDIVSDGASTLDPGCNCNSAVMPNVDMMQEVKVQTSNFSAEQSKGPIVVQTVSKAGTSAWHGEGYAYFRDAKFNATDWRRNYAGLAKPDEYYIFPGINIGGPLKKDKLFLFGALEWNIQNVGRQAHFATVPTDAMKAGDFSAVPGYGYTKYDITALPAGNGITGGKIPSNLFDPGGKVLINTYPKPNLDPKSHNGDNYVSAFTDKLPRSQRLVRLDYNFSESTKLYTRFNHETQEATTHYSYWWSDPTYMVPYPSDLLENSQSYSISNSLVNVLNPTTTNEVVFAATYWDLPAELKNPEKVDRQALGYPYKGIFKNARAKSIPNSTDWGGGIGHYSQPFDFVGFPAATKWLITLDEKFSKVMNTHTLKMGATLNITTNNQLTDGFEQGSAVFTNWGGNSTGNAYADMLMGKLGSYEESTANLVGEMVWRGFDVWAQDNWKVSPRLTLDLGLRLQHLGFPYDKNGRLFGFDMSKYSANTPANQFPELVANYLNPAVDRSIYKTPFLKPAPRLGWAYDLTGKGNTVIRGGAGMYFYREEGNVQFGALKNPPLIRRVALGWNPGGLADMDKFNPDSAGTKYALTVLDLNSDLMPVTYNWSLTLSQRLPVAKTVLEMSYVGNTSRHLGAASNDDNSANINVVPMGALFQPGTTTLIPNVNQDDYRPYKRFGNIKVMSHGNSQNYHSLQVSANRQEGRFTYQASYTFSKALGIGGDIYNTTFDSFDLRGRSYGPLPYDRTHIFSIAYGIALPSPARSAVARQILNGWNITGISQLQSGGPFGISPSGSMVTKNADGTFLSLGAQQVNGTPNSPARAVITCDPREGRGEGQYLNPKCFAAPTPGHNGMYQIPYLKGPGYMMHDLTVFKDFAIKNSETQKIQFRFAMYNFPNHPIEKMEGNDFQLQFDGGAMTQNTINNLGKASRKDGRRMMQFAIKYMF